MENNANKIIVAVGALMVVVLLGLVLTSGLNGGGGGGSSTPVATVSQDPVVQADPVDPVDPGTPNESYEELRDNLLKDLEEHKAPVGSNERRADASSTVHTTAALETDLNDRGFSGIDVKANFTIDGTYLGETKLGTPSSDRYPSYRVEYTSPSGVMWTIVANDGAFFATPLGAEGVDLTKLIILSESDHITQYDGATNCYSDFAFDQLGDGLGITVSRIDKATLDSYTPQMLVGM